MNSLFTKLRRHAGPYSSDLPCSCVVLCGSRLSRLPKPRLFIQILHRRHKRRAGAARVATRNTLDCRLLVDSRQSSRGGRHYLLATVVGARIDRTTVSSAPATLNLSHVQRCGTFLKPTSPANVDILSPLPALQRSCFASECTLALVEPRQQITIARVPHSLGQHMSI